MSEADNLNPSEITSQNSLIMYFIRIAPTIIPISIVAFNFLGHFGNLTLIVATIRLKSLQSKHGILLAVTCCEHSFCLIGELINAYFSLIGEKISRQTCLGVMTPYITINCCQSMMFLVLSIDVLLSILAPLRYQKIDKIKYCFFVSSIPFLFPFMLLLYAWNRISPEDIFMCNPPLALADEGTSIWAGAVVFASILTIIVYAFIYFWFFKRQNDSKNRSSPSDESSLEKKVMRSLSILVTVFCSSWVLCMGSVFFIKFLTENENIIILVQSYVVFFALIAFSQTFYVCYFRSSVYRAAFKTQICFWQDSNKTTLFTQTVSKTVVNKPQI